MKLKTTDFDYNLPKELIATTPLNSRENSRLLVVKDKNQQNDLYDTTFNHIIDYLNDGDLLIFNNSKVIKARLFGRKITGGKIEVLVERILDSKYLIAHVKSNKSINLGLEIILSNNLSLTIIDKLNGLFKLSSNVDIDFYEYLESFGHIPLPHYMLRDAEIVDQERYQTIYAKELGSVAAPTAGLHFTEPLIQKIRQKGVQIAYVTLHIGSGTFKPVSVEDISEHKMHGEIYSIPQETIDRIKTTKANHKNIIAVGTTSLRTLESGAINNFDKSQHETDIFITPGFKFKIVDKLITNFHLPKSTLLMLVSAFAGMDTIKISYQHAIESQYRFFSYGDAMLLSLNNI